MGVTWSPIQKYVEHRHIGHHTRFLVLDKTAMLQYYRMQARIEKVCHRTCMSPLNFLQVGVLSAIYIQLTTPHNICSHSMRFMILCHCP